MEKKQVNKADPGDYVDVHQLLTKLFSILVFIPYCVDLVLGSWHLCIYTWQRLNIESPALYF